MKKYFDSVNPKVNFPELEESVIKYWKENMIFEKSVTSRPESKTWTFLDGPPFITGMPHYGTLLSSIPKDLFPRYWTMKGYRVRRVWGWDCHGLPAENKVENKLGIKRKKDIEEKVGVKKFIDECKLYVKDVSSEWKWYVDHIGRWVDFDNAYKTMDTDYMESVMWVFKTLYDNGHIYKGLRVSLYCPHCSTPISNFEVAMDADNYKEITEEGTTYKYKLEGEENTYILAWSTTPWNKIATPALAVNPELIYVLVNFGKEKYILAKSALGIFGESKYKIEDEFIGEKLIGRKFIPHYDFYKADPGKKTFVIIRGDFVTAEEGTGVVTIAAYGEEDLAAMNSNNIQIVQHVDDEGMIKNNVPKFAGMYYLDANESVNKDLEQRGLIFKSDPHTHTVPTCWRCHTRLYYSPQNAWYVDIQKLKPLMKKTNKGVNWFPKHFKFGRFMKSMEAAPDWCISRSRYWGSPVPVWECECGNRIVPGSINELEKLSGRKIIDLHKPDIDEVEIKCSKCGKNARRVSEVLDSWIEAGSASFAERHFPFDDKVKLEDFFPPDFIVEYTGQIRAWFYVLHVLSTALYKSNAFKNVVVTGVILGTDGRKMSKNFGNYPDPKDMLQKYGGDALRLYLMGSPVMKGEDVIISEEEYRNQIRGFLLILWNIYNFFVTYANIDDYGGDKLYDDFDFEKLTVIDRWIISDLNLVSKKASDALENYDTTSYVDIIKNFVVDDLSGWYVRRIRNRVGPSAAQSEDKQAAYKILQFILINTCRLLAPVAPFVSEEIFRNLTKGESVHLESWPEVNTKNIDESLLSQMKEARKLVEIAFAQRKAESIKVRQPLKVFNSTSTIEIGDEVLKVVAEEINVLKVQNKVSGKIDGNLDTKITEELKLMGQARDLVRQIQEERKNINTSLDELVDVSLPDWPKSLENEIKKKALIGKLTKGEFKVVKSS